MKIEIKLEDESIWEVEVIEKQAVHGYFKVHGEETILLSSKENFAEPFFLVPHQEKSYDYFVVNYKGELESQGSVFLTQSANWYVVSAYRLIIRLHKDESNG